MSTALTQKKENVQRLHEELSEVPHAILVDFRGLNVEGATDLRRKLRDGEARFKVVKNSTVRRAVEDLPLAELSDAFVGQTAIAYTDGDIVNLAKVLTEFAKDFETPRFKGGIVDGAPISAEEFEQLSQLPPRDELVGKLVYLMAYPMTGLATALNGILQGFAVVLDQVRQQKEEAGESEPQPAEEVAAETAAAEEPAEQAAAAADDEPAADAEAASEKEPAEGAEAASDEGPAEEAATVTDGEAAKEAEAAADEEPAEEAEGAPDEAAEEEARAAAAEEEPETAEAAAEEPETAEAAADEASKADDADDDEGAADGGEEEDKK